MRGGEQLKDNIHSTTHCSSRLNSGARTSERVTRPNGPHSTHVALVEAFSPSEGVRRNVNNEQRAPLGIKGRNLLCIPCLLPHSPSRRVGGVDHFARAFDVYRRLNRLFARCSLRHI